MVQPQTASFEEITKELYSKNVDLVNANKLLEMIQKLYEIMISSHSVESVSQRFIDVITQTLGFTDGIVVEKQEKNSHLKVVGITQTEVNKTILEMANVATVDLKFGLGSNSNALVRVFNKGKSEVINDFYQVWSPYVKQGDLSGINSVAAPKQIFVYPIIYGDKTLGSFAVLVGKGVENLTVFEKKALDRLVTVFGIAIDRIRINLELHVVEERELAKARELLKLKDEFVFIATHDLKTPVTAIDGYISLIKEDKPDFSKEVEENFEAVEEASERLKQLVNDLLEVARGESGTIKVEVKSMDVNELIDKVVKEVKPTAEEKHVSLNINLDQANKIVMGDSEKLAEVLENLLSNAVKFSKPEGGKITITTKRLDAMLEVVVADNGFGIPKAEQQKVFTKFFKYRGDNTRKVPGTGLGLFVVRMLVEKMGGRIGFTSEEGVGTTFSFTIPIAG